MVDSAKKQLPIKEGMMKLPQSPSDKGSLIGCKCRKCGQLFFVKREMCENCQSQDLEEITLSGTGKLYAFSIMYYPAPPPYKPSNPFVPFGIGWVELPEGLVVYSLLTENDASKLKVGMKLELILSKFTEDKDGNDVIVPMFKPVK
ncbi:MAG: OB-fold domain-containing protein [Chloroflexi bacterium]|nr:OB-fold domain-containing protein [Chloroflexota bacterium]